jgi:hypothetical protein
MEEDIASPIQLTSQASRLKQQINRTKPELRSRDKCRSIEDHVAYLALRLNTSFALATFLRRSLETEEHWQEHPNEQGEVRRMCAEACIAAVESFVDLHKISVVAERSWAMLHNGLSCALILLLIGEAETNEKAKNLQKELVSIMSQSSQSRDQNSLLWAPHARIITAMKLLGSARSARPAATPPVQSVLPNEQPTSSSSNNYGNEMEEATLDQGNGFFSSNNSSTFPEFSDLDLNQHSFGTLYDYVLWGDYQPL